MQAICFSGFTQKQTERLLGLGYTEKQVAERVKEGFSPKQIADAVEIKLIHDRVEVAAYRGLQQAVVDLKLVTAGDKTEISTEQSRTILHTYVKAAAHRVMRAKDGYVTVRSNYLDSAQMAPIIKNVPLIVRDRDSKLTNATYSTFEGLVQALDDHNTLVNGILFNAWGVPHREDVSHLDVIKKEAGYIGPPNKTDTANTTVLNSCEK